MTQPHKHADLLTAIASGKSIEYRSKDDIWYPGSLITLALNQDFKWRVKPATVMVNGCEVPAENHGYNRTLIRISADFRDGHSRALQFANEADARQVYAALIKPFEVQG